MCITPTCASDTCSLLKKLVPETCASRHVQKNKHEKIGRKFLYFVTVSRISTSKMVDNNVDAAAALAAVSLTTGRPITLHGLSHMRESFCPETELCSIAWKKLAQEKTCKRLTDTRASFLYKTICTSFLHKYRERVSPALITVLWILYRLLGVGPSFPPAFLVTFTPLVANDTQ